MVKEVTSAVLSQSSLDNEWWADPMECYTNLRNIQDLLSDGKTPHESLLNPCNVVAQWSHHSLIQ